MPIVNMQGKFAVKGGGGGGVSAPSTPSITNKTSNGFTVSWSAVTGAIGYRLDISTDSGFSSFVSGYNSKAITETSEIVTGLSSNTTYYARVRTVSVSADSSSASDTTEVLTLLSPGLQAFYKLSDTSDSSGNNNTLTVNGNVQFDTGKIGLAASVNYSSFLNRVPFDIAGDFSVSFWGLAPYDGGNGAIFVNQYPGFFICTRNDGSVGFGDMSNWESNASAGTVTANTWYHYCLVRSGGTANLYINNTVVTSSSENLPNLTNDGRNFGFFGSPEDGHIWDSGSIDAVGIWNRALNEEEVSALYNSGNGLELN